MKRTILTFLSLILLSQIAVAQSLQKVVIEEHTGAWCGYCSDGALLLEPILTNQPNAIAVSVHNGDAMYNSTGGTIQGFYNPAYPQATINRSSAPISRGSWASAVNVALQNNPVAVVSIDSAGFDFNTRVLKVKVKATFLRDTTGQLRLNMYLTEDHVIGSGSGYDQVSYFNTQSGHPLYGLGNPILNYEHNHVFRDAAAGAWGYNGAIPTTVSAGEEFSVTFTKTISANWDINNMHIVGLLNSHLSTWRNTLNAEEVPFSIATGFSAAQNLDQIDLAIAPNPLQNRSTISFNLNASSQVSIEIFSLTGQKVITLANDFTNSGMHSLNWDGQNAAGSPVSNGVYFVRLTTDTGANVTRRLLVNR